MDYKYVQETKEGTLLVGVEHFDIDTILDCGQCFRWTVSGERQYTGVALGRILTLRQQDEGNLLFLDTAPEEFERYWHCYFDFERDYGAVKKRLCTDTAMARAVAFCPGMRVVRQEPWEALCTFIISQNNNIPRIKGIVDRLCRQFGERLGAGYYSFPTPERLAGLEPGDLAGIRSGFRGKYILDAARRVHSGEIPLQALPEMDIDDARRTLQQIMGVGPKVAECALLYGCARAECVPVDVWIARAMDNLYPQGFPEDWRDIGGIAQQYLFHYMRKCEQAEGYR